jgi:hypothetical protein
MYPMLKPALRRGWRDRQTVQFGVAPAHAVVLGPVDTATGVFLTLLDGTRGMPLLRQEADAMGLPARRADELVERLATAGLLDDPTAGGAPEAALRERGAVLERLRPDLASLSVVHPEPGAGIRRLAARRALRVQVRGAGRVGAAVAALLSAAGLGQVEVTDGGCVEPRDVGPGGLAATSAGERLVRDIAPDPRPPQRDPGASGPDPGWTLAVIAPRDGLAAYAPDPATADGLLASGTPHLYAGVIESTGVVGPLVLPGCSPCASCLALGRAERDPVWPRLLAQWRSGRGPGAVACDGALASVVASMAAVHALVFLDGGLPVLAGGRMELALPDLAWVQQPIEPHRDCLCGAAGTPGAEYPSVPAEGQATMSR